VNLILWAECVAGAEINWRPNAENYRRKALHCCMTIPVLTLPPHCWNPPPIGASSLQSWSSFFGLPLVWSTQRRFKTPPLCRWPRSEGSDACVTCHLTKSIYFFLGAYKSLWAAGQSTLNRRDTMCNNDVLVRCVLLAKSLPLHARKALGRTGGISPAHSLPRH
jgi:hypothetical protein